VRTKLLDLLDEVSGRKALLLDSTIVGPLDLIVSPSDLKDHGVTNWYKLSEQAVAPSDCTQMIFLIRCARVELVEWVANQILADEAGGADRTYVVVFVPRKTKQCMECLNHSNVRANVKVVECGIHFFPTDRDIISMEMPGVFNDFHVRDNPSGAFYTAKALMFLQSKFGTFPTVHGIGAAAKVVIEVMSRLRREEQLSDAAKELKPTRGITQPGVPPVAPLRPQSKEGLVAGQPASGPGGAERLASVDEVIIVDRRVDLFSVLCSQFTYQALIDMVFGINNQSADLTGVAWAKERNKEQVRLSSEDVVYREVRDLHIDKLGPLLQEKAQAIQKTYAEKDDIKHASEMSEYIKKFKTAQSAHPLLELHINLAQSVRDAIQTDDYRQHLKFEDEITAQTAQTSLLECIEDWIDDLKPFHEVMRLLCLHSLVNNGIKKKDLDQTKKVILQAYGYEHLLTLCNLEKVGLLRYQQGKSGWSSIKQKFNLFPEDTTSDDISYAYSGYVPLSVRLVQMTKSVRGGWRGCKDALNLLWGSAEELKQIDEVDIAKPLAEIASPARPSVTLVVFVGGLTYGEMATLRKLSEQEGGRKFLVLTTELLNARKLFKSLRCEEVFNQPPVQASKAKEAAAAPARSGFGFWPGGR